MAAMQREEPVGVSGRTRAIRLQPGARLDHQLGHERRLCKLQLNSVGKPRGRLLQRRANWRYRPNSHRVAAVVLLGLGVDHQQVDLVPLRDSVLDGPHAAALAAALRRVTHLADATATLDERAARGVFNQRVLKPSVFLIAQQREHLARECRRLDEFHWGNLYANGG